MSPMIPAGPYRTLTTPEGGQFPYYIVPFDKEGRCEGPRTQEHLLGALSDYSDVFLFSHGWNNDWSAATARYESFIKGAQRQRQELHLPVPSGYRPLLVGVFWPSQAMAWFESERGPDIAAAPDPAAQDAAAEQVRETLADIAAMLASEDRERFYVLVQAESLGGNDARELATMLAGVVGPDDEGPRGDAPSADDLLGAASALAEREPDLNEVGTANGAGARSPRPAGLGDLLEKLDPRNLIKPFTVWQMKDRAGRVGAQGVAALLREILTRSDARVHLLGHSFGCKVVMTAASALPEMPRKMHSALLLQAAVSQYAFSPSVPGRQVPGGFVRALTRVERPVVATYSGRDRSLHDLFHKAVRRHEDIGELQIAAAGTPSAYGALGGYGPIASDATMIQIQDPGAKYDLGNGGRIVGVDGTRAIAGHGDISNPATWWLSYSVALAQSS